jgi:hypothetical protein
MLLSKETGSIRDSFQFYLTIKQTSMRLFLKYSMTMLLFFAVTRQSMSQGIILDFANRKVSPDGMSWSFDLMGKGDPNYVGPDGNLWIALNLRLDLALPAGVTITGGTGNGSPTFASASIGVQVGNFVPGGGPAGTQKLGLTLERANNNTDLNTSSFVKMADYTISFSAPVEQNNPATPRPIPNVLGSSWSNSADENASRFFLFVDDTFPLPVKLVSFDAGKEGDNAILTWSTTEETNSDRFDVQRSQDGKKWVTFQTIKALGESFVEHSYSAIDESPLNGENLYRLHMIDKDGTSAYSQIQSLDFVLKSAIAIFPNPVSSELNIQALDFTKVGKVQIYSPNGMELYNSGPNPIKTVNVKGLSTGMYILRITEKNNVVSNHKILVAK